MADASTARSVTSFFSSHGLTEKDRLACDLSAQALFPNENITPAPTQGCCSYTVLAGDRQIVQFRPRKYQLDPVVIRAAKEVYSDYAPSIHFVGEINPSGLLMYTMEKIPGISYKEYRSTKIDLTQEQTWNNQVQIIEDFAHFLVRSWHHRAEESPARGKVGSTIAARLHQLTQELPLRLRPSALAALKQIRKLDALPWVLTHGDIVPSNIMVDPTSSRLTGFVDWAEAEVLPFGLCLYGLEELLGFMTSMGWMYCHRSECLRSKFWRKLLAEIPDLAGSLQALDALSIARNIGVLLWHGFAWDDGAIDRVVRDGYDEEEICRLDAFLEYGSMCGIPKL